MKVYIASDHAGFALKEAVAVYVRSLGHHVEDLGATEFVEGDDYPDVITPCAVATAADTESLGIVFGGSGQGEAMAANRVGGARASVFYGPRKAPGAIEQEGTAATDEYDIVRLARRHNDANILSIGARFVSEDEACEAVRLFLETEFSGEERHARRVQKLA